MCSESLGAGKISYSSCAHQEICESLAALGKFLIIRFDRSVSFECRLVYNTKIITAWNVLNIHFLKWLEINWMMNQIFTMEK